MKIPDNLAEMYSTLTAKSPEMVVDGLAWMQDPSGCITLWNRSNEGIDWRRLRHDEASALIRSHWEDELRDGMFLFRFFGMFAVVSDLDNVATWYPDPITALYHEHMRREA